MEPIKAPKGTHDILPGTSATWRRIEDAARDLFGRYRFVEIRTPIFEATELFARGMGEATDVVSKEMYTFQDRGDRSVTLRPEGTAGVVRAYVEHRLDQDAALGHPTKLWYGGPMFRYERPQKGRQRQFHQMGVEILGSALPQHDAEAIMVAMDLFASLALTGLSVQLNSLGCEACRPGYRDHLGQYLEAHQADYCETCRDRMVSNPLRVLDCKVPACRALNQQAPSIQEVLCEACQQHQRELLTYLDEAEVRWQLNPSLVRGLDYYTRTVFEIVSSSDALGSQNTVCAGGRYDGLVQELGGPVTPAIGWAFGMERLVLILGTAQTQPPLDLYLAPLGHPAEHAAFKEAHRLRQQGFRVELGAGKLDRQLKQATRLEAVHMGILGDQELTRGQIQLKHLATRTQALVDLAELPLHLRAGVAQSAV